MHQGSKEEESTGHQLQAKDKESIVANFKSLDSSVKSNYGLFLAEYMRCIYTLFQEAQASHGTIAGGDQSSSSAYLTSLRREAVVLRNHAMCIDGTEGQYTLTDHDIRKLMQYESNMRV